MGSSIDVLSRAHRALDGGLVDQHILDHVRVGPLLKAQHPAHGWVEGGMGCWLAQRIP